MYLGDPLGSCGTWKPALQGWVKYPHAFLSVFFHQPLKVRTSELASDGRYLIPLAQVLLEDASALQECSRTSADAHPLLPLRRHDPVLFRGLKLQLFTWSPEVIMNHPVQQIQDTMLAGQPVIEVLMHRLSTAREIHDLGDLSVIQRPSERLTSCSS